MMSQPRFSVSLRFSYEILLNNVYSGRRGNEKGKNPSRKLRSNLSKLSVLFCHPLLFFISTKFSHETIIKNVYNYYRTLLKN